MRKNLEESPRPPMRLPGSISLEKRLSIHYLLYQTWSRRDAKDGQSRGIVAFTALCDSKGDKYQDPYNVRISTAGLLLPAASFGACDYQRS